MDEAASAPPPVFEVARAQPYTNPKVAWPGDRQTLTTLRTLVDQDVRRLSGAAAAATEGLDTSEGDLLDACEAVGSWRRVDGRTRVVEQAVCRARQQAEEQR